jgi:peptide-methionine (S)-S-oxide reductase
MNKDYAIFASGCFWCTEAIFENLNGVISVIPGYIGGTVSNPSYEQVCTGTTGHAEAIKITYDRDILSFENLLKVFFETHDPTTLNRQGNDIGTQYRSSIFYKNEFELNFSKCYIAGLEKSGIFSSKVVTTLEMETKFFEAEEYHKKYFYNNPENTYCQLIVKPKIDKFKLSKKYLLKK